MSSTPPIVVELVRVGELPREVDLDRLVRLLRCQKRIEFRLRPQAIDPARLAKPRGGYFFTENEILAALEPGGEGHFVVAVTSLRIAPSTGASDPDNEHFGVWHNAEVPLDPEFARRGVISVTRWRERYESRAYRSTEQFLAFMTLAFLGDALLGGLTHPWCTGCVFDYNLDDESIVSSVKSAELCKGCRERVRSVDPPLADAYSTILRQVGRPPVPAVLRYLQGNGVTSVLLFSGLLALSVGLLQSVFPDTERVALATSLLCGAVFVGVVFYYRHHPSGDLK